MADEKITGLTEATVVESTDLLYMGRSPFGATDDRKITIENFLASIINTDNLQITSDKINTTQDISTTSDVTFNDVNASGNLDSATFGVELLNNTTDASKSQDFNITPSEGVAIVTIYVRDDLEFDIRQFIVGGNAATGSNGLVGEIIQIQISTGGSLFSFTFVDVTAGVIKCNLLWLNISGVVKMRVKQWFGATPAQP